MGDRVGSALLLPLVLLSLGGVAYLGWPRLFPQKPQVVYVPYPTPPAVDTSTGRPVLKEEPRPPPDGWEEVGDLAEARDCFIFAALADGGALAAGGFGPDITRAGPALRSAEVFDPAARTFSLLEAEMREARHAAAAVRLRDGHILICGGGNNVPGPASRTCEVFDPAARSFALLRNRMTEPRVGHSMTLLLDGRVLIAGGQPATGAQGASATAEIFTPGETPILGTFRALSTRLSNPRVQFPSVLLPDGRVLIVSGSSSGGVNQIPTTDLFDPRTNRIGRGPRLPIGDAEAGAGDAVVLDDGRVLVTNFWGASAVHPDAFVLPLLRKTFERVGDLALGRYTFGDVVRLHDGHIMNVGGRTDPRLFSVTDRTEIFDPATNAWSEGPTLLAPRMSGLPDGPIVLADGSILVAGSWTPEGDAASAHAEILTPTAYELFRRGGAPSPDI